MVMITVRTDEIPKPKLSSTLRAHDDLKTLPLLEVEKHLGTLTEGLPQTKTTRLLTQYGLDEIVEKKTNTLRKILSSFRGPIPR